MNKNLICIVFVMFAGCSAPQEGAQTPVTESYPQQEEVEQQPLPDKPPEMDPETRAAYEEAVRRHPPSPMLPSRRQDPVKWP